MDRGPRVRLRSATNSPYDGAIAAARTCYSPRVIESDEITEPQRRRIGPLTFEGGHHTVFQHASFEFAISGVSRQLVWSFLHSFPFYNTEQQSQRYVRLDEVAAHVPPALAGEARGIYTACIERAWQGYAALAARLAPLAHARLAALWRLQDRQNAAFGKSVAREAEKKAIETARYVIPIACHTAMVYTVSGLVLHRLRRMARVGDVPDEALDVVQRMVAEVEQADPNFFRSVGQPPLEAAEIVEERLAPPGLGDPAVLEAFDKSLDGRTARLVGFGARAPEAIADAVRHVLGRADLSDAEALDLVLDPARNPYRLERLNVSTHAPLMRSLAHAHFVFRKKLSHTADSQDQRHRTVPGSRPLLSRTVPAGVDVVEPELIRSDPACHGLFREVVEAQWEARAQLLARGVDPRLALYVLPNALAVRFEESGTLLDLLHKWTMRSCLNAQWEIWQASMEEIEQVRAVQPKLVEHVGPPCFVRSGLARPRCTEGAHFCGIPVWRSFPETRRVL
ncbi:MAG: FAD-dependent thymidylate synthase [Myxococcales bacterium]|nr:FAD-dependent thymidylate synthase [Myxococcales bacterium]MDH5307458.1 FAD-dependent thymidylate synthase [Myxococcales bacterium]MDH5565328.1 FAD-dependent thymidylate synthase [Myxococcales bacterium]